jgi:hypothetical protein
MHRAERVVDVRPGESRQSSGEVGVWRGLARIRNAGSRDEDPAGLELAHDELHLLTAGLVAEQDLDPTISASAQPRARG